GFELCGIGRWCTALPKPIPFHRGTLALGDALEHAHPWTAHTDATAPPHGALGPQMKDLDHPARHPTRLDTLQDVSPRDGPEQNDLEVHAGGLRDELAQRSFDLCGRSLGIDDERTRAVG